MKKLFAIFVLMVLAVSGIAQETHFDFSVTSSTGYAIFYRIIEEDNLWVEATYPCQNGDNYWWGFDQPEGKLILSETVNHNGIDYTLVAIGDHAFSGCTGLRGVLELPQTLTAIGEGAFKGCSNISGNLNIPNCVTRIEEEAFANCSGLSGQLRLSDSLTFIGNKAFYHCSNLSDRLVIPNKTTQIGNKAFEQCGFSGSIRIPASLDAIGTEAFKGLSAINTISTKALVPPTTVENAFEGFASEITLFVPYNTLEAYQNAPGWSRFAQKTIEKSLWNGTAELWTQGNGTIDDPYLIESAEQLAWLSKSVNETTNMVIDTFYSPGGAPWIDTTYYDFYAYRDTYFRLVTDIDLQNGYGLKWNSIGNKHYKNDINYCNYFCGHFDGNNHEISNFTINVPTNYSVIENEYYYGLFGIVLDGSINNIVAKKGIFEVHDQQNKCIGGIVGKCINGRLTNCHTNAEWIQCGHVDDGGVTSLTHSSVGGIVGVAEKSLIENCSGAGILKVVCEILSNSDGKYGVGGIAGVFRCDDQPNENNTIFGCSFTGTVDARSIFRQGHGGGIVGLCTSATEGSGTIKFEKCFSKGVLRGACLQWSGSRPFSLGGIVGCVYDLDTLSVLNCYSNESLTASANDTYCYVGGIVGKAESNTTLIVKNCYHTGDITSYHSGGIIAQNTDMTLVRNCYFDQSSAPDDGFGVPLSSDYMKTEAFVNQLNNGSTVFRMDTEPFVNDGYPVFGTDGLIFVGAEWYYEILNDDGSITYQHLQCTGDTTIHNKRPKVIIRSNTQYDKGLHTEVTHEYVYEENGVIYWWNKDLEKFTILYDFSAEVGDEWTIEVGDESITTHVYESELQFIEGIPYKKLTIADPNNVFSGNLLSSIGHMTSFFPERLMTRGKGYSVEGLRCYWLDDELIYKLGDEDCDAIYEEWHHGINETMDDMAFAVYPNPADNVLFVETCHGAFLQNLTYCITNPLGQTILSGHISAENQQINIETLPAGMYFITFAGETLKFVVR
jgi:hypothetical protein